MMMTVANTLFSLLLLCACRFGAHAKEIIATNEWQKVGPTDTVPAGLEIRMDLSGGGKWARLPPEEEEDISQPPHAKHCGPSCKERQKQRAEKRRAAGFKLREASHTTRRRQHEEEELSEFGESPSILHVAGVLMLGLTIGLGVATRFRRKIEGLHEN